MAQVFIQMSKMFCNLPGGRYIVPIISPIISPPQLLLVYLPTLLIMHYAFDPNSYNSDDGQKNIWKTSRNAFLFYWLFSAIIIFPLLLFACHYIDEIPDIPGVTTTGFF
jgi:hypothetical protein